MKYGIKRTDKSGTEHIMINTFDNESSAQYYCDMSNKLFNEQFTFEVVILV